MKKLLMIGAAFAAIAGYAGTQAVLRVEPETVVGPIKPVNGVGQPPMIGKLSTWSMMHYLKEAGIPYSRLHDAGGWLGGGLFVDIPNLFRNFAADEKDPANYTFAYTDSLIKALVDNGVEPFFRLGGTIENFVEGGLPPVNTLPPPDAAKWARICERVIRHYTEGWANGYKYKIEYWEIWNEPDNQPDAKRNPMWGGDWKSFCDFYGTVAPYLKAKFPQLKIGGYGSCGFYAAVGSGQVKTANSTPRLEYFLDCATNFLARAKAENWPLDFFSFHSYSEVEEALRQVKYADELLTQYGFERGKTERIFNEWLPEPAPEALGSERQAAAVAAELIELQKTVCDLACIYDARCGVGNYSPLFDPSTLKPRPAYKAFLLFNELRKLGTEVKSRSSDPKINILAARRGTELAVMVVNYNDKSIPLSVEVRGFEPVEPLPKTIEAFGIKLFHFRVIAKPYTGGKIRYDA